MILNKKNKIGSGIIVEGSGTNLWVNFHKVSKDVFIQYPCQNEPEFFCKFKEFKNKIIPGFVSYPELIKVDLEYTDTVGGDANYSWVKNDTIEVLENISDRSLISIAKKQMGIDLRNKTPIDCGDFIRLDFYKSNTVLFITFFQG